MDPNLDTNKLKDAPKFGETPKYGHGFTTILKPGVDAPDFCLPVSPEQAVCLHDFRGKIVVLDFYPSDWIPPCSDRLALLDMLLPEFKKYKAVLLAISTDNPWSHMAFAKDRKLHFPLLSDFDPKGAVARKYGVYDDSLGMCDRAIFIVDGNGKIFWNYLAPIGISPGADRLLEALDTLAQGRRNKESP